MGRARRPSRWIARQPLGLAVVERLARRPGLTARAAADLAADLGCSLKSLAIALAALRKKGLVDPVGPPFGAGCRWRLAPGVTLRAAVLLEGARRLAAAERCRARREAA